MGAETGVRSWTRVGWEPDVGGLREDWGLSYRLRNSDLS